MYKKRLIILSIILIVLSTIAYSGLATGLSITGEANIRAVSDIRVTDITLDKGENGAVEQYKSKYTKNGVTTGIKLPNINSTISYKVEITNKGDMDEAIYELSTVSNNTGLKILIDGEEVNNKLPIIVPYRTKKVITITYATTLPSNETINVVNTFTFKHVYYITYETDGGSTIERQIKYEDVDINITNEKPVKEKYVFTGWTDEQNGQTVKYNPNDLYTLNQNKTLYAIYRQGEAVFLPGIEFNVKIKQLSNPTLENITYETDDTNITSIRRYTSTPSASILATAEIVSTQNSDIPIYAWYDNGTIYYYTLADNPYIHKDSSQMFRTLKNVESIDLSTINTDILEVTNSMFYNCNHLASLDLSNFNTSKVFNMGYMFYGCSSLSNLNLSSFDTSKVQYMHNMFCYCQSLTSLNLNNFDTSNVTNMLGMFSNCNALTSITFGNNFITSKVTNMSYMFSNCFNLQNIDLSKFNTSNVTNMSYMFYNCRNLTSLDLSKFNTSSVKDMSMMFYECRLLANLDVSNFNTSNVETMRSMFYGCNSLTSLNLNNWNTSKVTDMGYMFNWCNSLTNLNLSSFNTIIVEDMSYMFNYCSALVNLDISNFNMGSVTNIIYFLNEMTSLTSLKTPSVYLSDLTINLPKTLYDVNGNGYTTLDSSSPTQTWIKLGYTVVFDKNNNDATGTMSNQIIQFDTATQLHTNTYTRSGYIFTGWNTKSDGTGEAYLDGAIVTSLAQANGTITLYAQWREGEATFLYGRTFNETIKQLANPTLENITQETTDTNITSIQKYTSVPTGNTLTNAVVVSATGSDYDIYAWYDNGTIYYYSEAVNLYFNTSAFCMFANLLNVESIDINTIDTSRTIIMQSLFNNDLKLESVNTSSFNTNIATDMRWMFNNNKKIQKLDLSSFNLSNIVYNTDMLRDMTVLEQLKTPKVIPNEITITLPKTLYDEEGNAYTQLDSTTPTEEWLRIKYKVSFDNNGGEIITSFTGQTITLSGAQAVPVYYSDYLQLEPNIEYKLSFDYRTLEGTNTFDVDLYPDTLPQKYPHATTELQHYDWIFSSESNDISNCRIRFFDDVQGENEADIIITNIHLYANSKEVTVGQPYGTLPTPTRKGYTFKGWNGKNLFNPARLIEGKNIVANEDESIHAINTESDPSIFRYDNSQLKMTLSAGTYSLTLKLSKVTSNNSAMIAIYKQNLEAALITQMLKNKQEVTLTFTLNEESNIGIMLKIYDGVANIQLEEGSTATPWEPYYITPTTTVVQDKDHTLKAIWEPNTYNVVFDKNDNSATGSMSNQTMTYGTSSNLTTNAFTRTGYKFIGWNTRADGTGTAYLDGASVSNLATTGTVTLYAQWVEGDLLPSGYQRVEYIESTGTQYIDLGINSNEHPNIVVEIDGNYTSSSNSQYIFGAGSSAVDINSWILMGRTEQLGIIGQIGPGGTEQTIISGDTARHIFKLDTIAKQVAVDSTIVNVDASNLNTFEYNYLLFSVSAKGKPTSSAKFRMYSSKIMENGEYILYLIPCYRNSDNVVGMYDIVNGVFYDSDGSGDFRYSTMNPEVTYNYNGVKNYFNQSSTTLTNFSGINNYSLYLGNLNIDDIDITDKLIMTADISYENLTVDTSKSYRLVFQIYGDVNYWDSTSLNLNKINYTNSGTDSISYSWSMPEGFDDNNFYRLQIRSDYYTGGSISINNIKIRKVTEESYIKEYGQQYGTLPVPTAESGYQFDGWYTEPVGGTKISTSTIATTDVTYYAHWLSIEPEARIRSLNTLNTSIADDDPDNNLRFIGANPNNYVKFNNQTWRIIGIFDGKLKLVQDPIGNYSWDTSKETVNRGLGVNEWSQADLMKLLNPGYETNTDLKCKTNTTYVSNNGDGYQIVNCGDNSASAYEETNPLVNNSLYWNAGSGLCYNYGNYQTTSCNFTTTGLSDATSKNMIDDATWYLGSNDKSDGDIWGSGQIMTANYIYDFERGSLTGKQCTQDNIYCSDTVTRTTTWTGKVGLIYPSDYAYATSGGSTTNRDTCLGKQIGYVKSSTTPNWANTYTDCKDNNWLLNKSALTWSLSPRASSRLVFYVGTTGHVGDYRAMGTGAVRPVVFLKSGVKITNGEGTQEKPFELSLD